MGRSTRPKKGSDLILEDEYHCFFAGSFKPGLLNEDLGGAHLGPRPVCGPKLRSAAPGLRKHPSTKLGSSRGRTLGTYKIPRFSKDRKSVTLGGSGRPRGARKPLKKLGGEAPPPNEMASEAPGSPRPKK